MGLSKKLTVKDREIDEQISQIRRDKETIITLEGKEVNLRKEYQKFKDSVSEALNNSFSQVLLSFNSTSNEAQIKSGPGTLAPLEGGRKAVDGLSRDLINAINQAGKDNKVEVARLNEKIRLLEKAVESQKAEMIRSQEQFKKQLSEKGCFVDQL